LVIMTEERRLARRVSTKIMAEAIMALALTSVLNLFGFDMPQGGRVTPGSLVPLLWFAFRYGPRMALLPCATFSVIDVYEEPFLWYGPVQFLLDYLIPYCALSLAGFFKRRPILGVAVAIFVRFLSHFVSGVIFFAQFAPPGMNVYLYSALYNGGYLSVQFVISAVIVGVLSRRGLIQRATTINPRMP
jgi:thiamine transporter